MATSNDRIQFQVGFSVDKSGLSEMQSLFQQIANKAAEPGNKFNAGLQQAGKTAATLDTILSKTFNSDLGTLNVTKFNQELAKSGMSLNDVKTNLSQVGNQGVTAYNRLTQAILGTNQQIRQSSKLLDSMFTTLKNTIRYGISSSLFNRVVGSIEQAYSYTKKLDTSLNDIRIVTDKSAESMADFAESANKAAQSMGASTLDYTNASLIYYQQGLSDAEVAARTETTIKAANVTGQTGEEVSEQLTAVWNGYKVTAEETELYVDKLAAVAATTAADLEELSTGMSKVASAANAMGVDFDDLNAQIATIVSVTRQAPESVGTALKTIYARLGDLKVEGGVDEFGVSLGDVSSQLETMGIQILKDNGDLRDMSSVIAEIAEKWGTWTEAQRQAAAVAMAGKRQYNNLIALFDNWDMYTDALNTSTEAVGTLQHQQDIYMESTEAKLKTLRAAWQELYGDAIDTDEINAGIESLTNLVKVFDNFISSFGGGIKAIAGFGAIISSIFNKQIAESIINANQRYEVFKQNINLLQTKAQTFGDTNLLDSKATAAQLGVEANTQKQLDIAKQIYQVRAGLNEEQAKTLLNQQKETGELVEQKTVLENIVMSREQQYLREQQIEELLNSDLSVVESIDASYSKIVEDNRIAFESEEQSLAIIESILKEYEDIDTAKLQIKELTQEICNLDEKELDNLLDQSSTMESLRQKEAAILNLLTKAHSENEKQVQETERQASAIHRVYDAKSQIYDLDIKIQNKELEISELIKQGAAGANITQQVTSLTSALGNMAMAWSSVNSLIDTWNNEEASFGDKITQTLMTLGMTIPLVISNFVKMNEVLGVSSALSILFSTNKAKELALTQLSSQAKIIENVLLEQEAIKRGVAVSALEAEVKASVHDSVAKQAEKIATDQATNAQWRFNAALTANPLGLMLTALMAVAAGLAIYIASVEKARKATIETSEEVIKSNNAKQDEIKKNEELIQSYNSLFKKYQEGTVSRNELAESVEDLCDKYDIEQGKLWALTGQYDKLNAAISKKQKLEVKEKQKLSKQSIDQALLSAQAKAAKGTLSVSQKNAVFGLNSFEQAAAINAGKEKLVEQNTFVGDLSTAQGLIGYYNTLIELQKQYIEDKDVKHLKEVNEELDTYKDLVETVINEINIATQSAAEEQFLEKLDIFNNDEIDYNTFVEEYNNIFETATKTLNSYLQAGTITKEQYDDALKNTKSYLASLIKEYESAYKKLAEKETIESYQKLFNNVNLENWSEQDKAYLFSGKIQFDGIETEEELRQAFEIAKNSLSKEDLTIVASLRTKVISDKKLTKKQIEEAAGEQSTLAIEYETELAEFDNASTLEQTEILNQIALDKIDINKEYLKDAEKMAQKEIDLENQKIEHYTEEINTLRYRDSVYKDLSEEEKERLEELEDLRENSQSKINNLNEIIENGLSFEQINDINFDNLITGLDGVISVATVLKNLAEEVGENWTLAADNVQDFAKNFPQLFENQENYNTLQDGSIQLTEQGREALHNLVQERINDLQVQNEAYQIELQKQADIQKATAEYYEEQAQSLRDYLNGKKTGAQVEADLEQSLTDYKSKLVEATAGDDEELARIMQENLDNTTNKAREDTASIYDFWCGVGEAAAQASIAYLNEQFIDPGKRPSGGSTGGTNVSSYNRRNTGTEQWINNITDEQIEKMIAEAEKKAADANTKYSELISRKTSAGAQTQAAIHALENIDEGKAGKDSKSKSSSKDKDKELKKLDEEFDRYWEIHKALDQIDRDLNKLEKDQKNLYGKELIRSLKQENALLENQAQLYEQLAAAQEAEAAELRGTLSGYGVAFDASGAIINYAAATAQALQQYNDAINQYNAGLITESALKVYETAYENFKKALERYDTLFYQEIKETQEKLDDIRREMLANNLKAWEVEVQLKLDWKELERGWNDFLHEVEEDFQKVYKDLRVDVKNMLKDAKTYIGKEGTINTIIKAVKDVTKEIDKMMGGGSSDMFESVSQAQEKLKELNDQLQDAGKALHNLWKEAWDAYLDGIDQVADKFDDLMDQFERINDELEFQGKLIELIYGDEAYGLMSELYKGQINNTEAQIESLQQQVDMWKELFDESGATMENQAEWSEDQKKYYEQWMEAQGKLNDMVIEYIELLQKDYMNTVKDILKQFETFVTSGSSLDDVANQWEKIKENSDKYYDNVEKSYQIQTLANKYDQSIASSSSLQAQQKLVDLREKEIGYLREKEKLTEYDIKAADLRYQIALKEIALQDAQNNKNAMKLTRNEQGNWSYQYVADETDVASKQQDLLDLYNQLYQLSSDAYESNLESLQELQQKYLESAEEIANNMVLTEEEKQIKLEELRKDYLQKYKELAEENQLYRNDLATTGAGLLLEIYRTDEEAVKGMTERERDLIQTMINANIDSYADLEEKMKNNYDNMNIKSQEVMEDIREDWTSKAQEIANKWNGDDGDSVRNQVLDAYSAITQATEVYQKLVDQCAEIIGRDFGEEGIKGAIDRAKDATNDLRDDTINLVTESVPYLHDLRDTVMEVEAAWRAVQDSIRNAISLIEEYLRKVGEANEAAQQQAQTGTGGQTPGGSGEDKDKKKGTSGSSEWHGVYNRAAGVNPSTGIPYVIHRTASSRAEAERMFKSDFNSDSAHYAYMQSGGYTGSWGDDSGRLAVLHQKELVLNADDTKNFLSGVQMIRDMASINGSIENSILKAIAGMAIAVGKTDLGSGIVNNSSDNSSSVFNITAEFPNANDVNEIREAILSLPNLASQYVNSNLR